MPKLTAEQAIELLSEAGVVGVELVESKDLSDYTTSASTDAPISKDTLLQAIDTKRGEIITPRILSEKQNELHGKIAGKVNGALRSALSQNFGIPTGELEGLNDKDAMAKAVTYYKSSISGDSATFQAKLDDMITKHEALVSGIKSEHTTQLSALQTKLTDKEVMAQLAKDHADAKGLPVSANRAALAKAFRGHLGTVATIKYNEATNEVELYELGNPEMPLMNKTNTARMKPADFMEGYYKDLGLWNTDTRTENPAKHMPKVDLNTFGKGENNQIVSPIEKQGEMVTKWASGQQ